MMFPAIGPDGCRSHPIHQFGKSNRPRLVGLRTVLGVDYRERPWQSAEEVGQVAPGALPWVDVMLASEDELHVVAGSWEPPRQVETVLSTGVRLLMRRL
jgi:hypothetical protein